MNWKHYKALPPNEKLNEAYYIIGLDIGNETSGIAFYNLHENTPEPIDLSGGYGKPSIPTIMQYIPETKEWVFGEYAILNQGTGAEITLDSLVEHLGRFEYLDIDRKTISIAALLGLYIKEILGNVRNINPRAEIVGIVAAIPDKMSPEAREELVRAFKHAGYEKELIALVPSRECILAHYYANHTHKPPTPSKKILLLDYGSQEVRGGVYNINNVGEAVSVTALSNVFDECIGTYALGKDVNDLFMDFYKHNSGDKPPYSTTLTQQLTAFTYQHKDILFQKNIRTKPAKLYYNFVYPPFQQIIAHVDIERLINPYNDRFSRLISNTLGNTIDRSSISQNDIDAILCIGGGFEMVWAKDAVAKVFEASQINVYKNPKLVTAEGAAQVAANMLRVAHGHTYEIEDAHQLSGDIGIKSGDLFLPLALQNAFWWQEHQPMLVLVNDKVNGELGLSIAERTIEGHERILASPTLTGLPKRPKGTTQLKIGVEFASNTRMSLHVSDMGFGEMFPASGYSQEFRLRLA